MRILIIDMSYLSYRFYFGLKNEEHPVITGFSNLIEIAYNQYDKIIFCIDSKPLDREQLQKDYKANRDSKIEVHKQRDEILSLFSTLTKILFMKMPGKEADDLMAILFYKFKNTGSSVDIYTKDSDLFQLYTDGANIITNYNRYKKESIDGSWIEKENYGCQPHYYNLYKVLAGDKTDNIKPVIPRFGYKYFVEFAEIWYMEGSLTAAFERCRNDNKLSMLEGVRDKIITNYKLIDLRHYNNVSHSVDLNPYIIQTEYNESLIDRFNLHRLKQFLIYLDRRKL